MINAAGAGFLHLPRKFLPMEFIDLHHARINTAGTYLRFNGDYVFTIGIKPYHGRIPIVRIGGHREGTETGWQCALRETAEETGLSVELLKPPATYWADGDLPEPFLQPIDWPAGQETPPLLVVVYRREGETLLSLMYLTQADQMPVPSTEVKGLLRLNSKEIQWLCQTPMTLAQFLAAGGRASLGAEFDRSLFMEPFIQLRLLAKILALQPEL